VRACHNLTLSNVTEFECDYYRKKKKKEKKHEKVWLWLSSFWQEPGVWQAVQLFSLHSNMNFCECLSFAVAIVSRTGMSLYDPGL